MKPAPLDPTLIKAYNNGVKVGIERQAEAIEKAYEEGMKQQRLLYAEAFAKLVSGLETVPGIGEKTAGKVIEYFNQMFEGEYKS